MLILWIRGLEEATSLNLLQHPHSDDQIFLYITFMVI